MSDLLKSKPIGLIKALSEVTGNTPEESEAMLQHAGLIPKPIDPRLKRIIEFLMKVIMKLVTPPDLPPNMGISYPEEFDEIKELLGDK